MNGLCFSPDGKQLASISHEGMVCFWSLASRIEEKKLRKMGEFGPANVISYLPGGDTIAAFFPESMKNEDPRQKRRDLLNAIGVLHVWQVATAKEKTTQALDYPIFFVNATASCDGQWLAFGRDKTVFLCKATTGQNWKLEDPHLANVNRVAFSHDGQVLAASNGSQIHLFSTAARKYLRSIQRPGTQLQDFAFSPDGRYLLGTYIDNKKLSATFQLWELASETPALDFTSPIHHGSALVFAADGKSFFSAGGPTSAHIWGLEPASWRKAAPAAFDDKGLAKAWAALATLNGAPGYEAVWNLAAAGNKAVHFLKKQLTPVAPFAEPVFAKLLQDLDSGEFKVREAAMAELRRLGPCVEVELRRAAAKSPSLEAGRRLQTVLAELDELMRSPTALQHIRAVEVLERIATPEARQSLKELAGGLSEARLTREAAQALRRLDRKS